MAKLPVVMAALAAVAVAGSAQAAKIKVLSPSMIAIGEPAKEQKTTTKQAAKKEEVREGFVATVPPPPGATVKAKKPKVVSNPPAAGATAVSSEKTSAMGESVKATGQEINVDLNKMKMRLE